MVVAVYAYMELGDPTIEIRWAKHNGTKFTQIALAAITLDREPT